MHQLEFVDFIFIMNVHNTKGDFSVSEEHPHPPMEALESEPITTPPSNTAARMVV